jgi:large subunit ribosomal protein L32
MACEPKKRHSRQRQGKRRASIHLKVMAAVTCKNCGEARLPHIICKNCGFYKGREIIKPNVKELQPATT